MSPQTYVIVLDGCTHRGQLFVRPLTDGCDCLRGIQDALDVPFDVNIYYLLSATSLSSR